MILYFSGTGNTRWAAEVLGKATGERLIDISKAAEESVCYDLAEGERLGFCFPVHGWRPPLLVRHFIDRLTVNNAKKHYCYALCTAGDNIGETMDILEKDLAARGVCLDSAFSLIMPESYVGLPFMDVDSPENEKRKKDKAAKELEQYSKLITERKKGVKELTIGRWPKINSRIIGGYFTDRLITDKPFRVTEDRCIKCGRCAAACPVENVIWEKGSIPEWKRDGTCLACFSCYHHCPEHAIEYGKRTRKKGQYYFNRNKNIQ